MMTYTVWTCRLTLLHCPPEHRSEAADIIAERDMLPDPDAPSVEFEDNCASCDQAINLGRELAALGCTVRATCLEDDDGPGTVFMSTPELGGFWAHCQGDGDPYLTARQLGQLQTNYAGARGTSLETALDVATGGPWLRAIEALEATA